MYGCLVVGHLDAGNVVFVDYMIWTLHCSQCYRDLLGMNPAAGSKGYKGKKRGVSICPRVMTLFRKLAAFQGNTGVVFFFYVVLMQFYVSISLHVGLGRCLAVLAELAVQCQGFVGAQSL